MRLIVPMSGLGERFKAAGYTQPKPLIDVDGRPIIEHLLSKFPADWPKTFICNQEHLASTDLPRVLRRLCPEATIVPIPPHKKGPAWAVLEAARVDPTSIPDGEPCIVNYCDFSFSWDPRDFEAFTQRTRCDGAVLCYRGYHPEYVRPTLYAYCREDDGRMLEIKEKGHYTPDRTKEPASSGSYYYGSGALLKDACRRLMADGPLLKGEGYMSLTYNFLVGDGRQVRIYEIPWFMQWGTPEDLRDYLHWSRTYRHYPHAGRTARATDVQLLMPMAGRGSRFKSGLPKPLISVMGKPMFRSAIEHLPPTANRVLVVRTEFADAVRAADPTAKLVVLEGVTEGQAITCELGAKELDPARPVLVSSCDHGLVWDEARWETLLADEPDVVVVGQRGYGGAEITPKAFAYIVADGGSGDIQRVSVKEPVSAAPRNDLLLVGTFYFRNAGLMLEVIDELKKKNIRVNNEFYLDSVINLCVARGWKTKVFETDGYLCWGTPEALSEFNYWHAYFQGKRSPDEVV